MRKRLISLILMVCIIASLMSGLTVSAFADGNTVNYTMQAGDTVLAVCKSLGLDFFTCKQAIMKLNRLNSDADFNKLRVGQVIQLPASNADAPLIVGSGATGGTATTPGAGTGSGSVNVSSVQLLAGDYVAYYLVPHVVQAGETVYDICIAKGINFNDNADLIMKVNSIQSWNRLFVGRTILLPMTTPPASGSCIVVVAHKVVGGDTVYTLCQKYGISYKDSLNMLQILNKKENLAVIKVGQVLLIPINGVITGGAGGGTVAPPAGGNGGTTGGTTTNPGTNTTVRNITFKAPNGTITAKVDGAVSTKVIPGKTVSLSIAANAGYSMAEGSKVVVYLADNTGTVKLNADNTFVMPNADVRIEAQFVSGYEMTKVNDNAKGSVKLLVNGVEAPSAPAGAKVTVQVAPKEGYTVDSIAVVETVSKNSWYTLNNGEYFTMPAAKMTVTVTYKQVASYTLTKGAVSNGTFSIANSAGSIISKSSAGNDVEIFPKANNGYQLDKVSYTYKEGNADKTVTVSADANGKYIFKMPAANVTVNVSFKNVQMYSLTGQASNGKGTIKLLVNGNEVASAAAGTVVTVQTSANTGYKLSSIKSDQVTIKNAQFEMPACDVTVKATYVDMERFAITADSTMANGSYTLKADGKDISVAEAYEGQVITVVTEPADSKYTAGNIVVTTASGKKVTVDQDNDTFTMPKEAVTVLVKFKLRSPAIDFAAAAHGSGKAYVANEEVTKAKIGETVTIKLSYEDGYRIKSVKAVDAAGNEVALTTVNNWTYTFTMPEKRVTITPEFEPRKNQVELICDSNVGSKAGLQVNGTAVCDAVSSTVVDAKTGDTVTVVPNPAENSSLDKIIVTKADDVNTVVATSGSFTMPAYPVKITVYFK